jgi:uncharacterized protein (DUF302 family)
MSDNPIKYGTCVTTHLSFERAASRVRELLKDEGFGVLTEIDVAKTLKEKRGIDFQPYLILGACNPDFAYEALKVEEQLGLLLPCNVVVTVHAGTTEVSAVDAEAMLGVVGKPSLVKIANDVDLRLRRVLALIAAE